LVEETDLQRGSLYPPLRDIRRISLAIAVSVAEKAYELKLARARRPRSLKGAISRFMYEP
jgi:malate dehydrogenase (oxaloacetate-decarboxylating)(NADP+)